MSLNKEQLLQKIHTTIPISEKMGYEIVDISGTAIDTRAPLQLNINIHNTGFAGSLYSIAALTAWSLCHHAIASHQLDTSLVVAKANIDYYRPVESDIECHCETVSDEMKTFIDTLQQGQRAKLNLEVIINDGKANMRALMVATPKA